MRARVGVRVGQRGEGVVCGVWCVVCGVWYVVCGVMVCGVWCVVCGSGSGGFGFDPLRPRDPAPANCLGMSISISLTYLRTCC